MPYFFQKNTSMSRWTKEDYQLHLLKKNKNKFRDENVIRFSKEKPKSANLFTKQVIGYLEQNGFKAWRNNTMGVFDASIASYKLSKQVFALSKKGQSITKGMIKATLGKSYRKSHEHVGASDVFAVHQGTGVFFCFEIKVGKDTVKDKQVEFIDDINKAGGYGCVARCLWDVIEVVRNFEEENKPNT